MMLDRLWPSTECDAGCFIILAWCAGCPRKLSQMPFVILTQRVEGISVQGWQAVFSN